MACGEDWAECCDQVVSDARSNGDSQHDAQADRLSTMALVLLSIVNCFLRRYGKCCC